MIRAFPAAGSTAPVVIVDQPSLQAALAAQSQPPLPVTGWWLRTARGAPAGPAGRRQRGDLGRRGGGAAR